MHATRRQQARRLRTLAGNGHEMAFYRCPATPPEGNSDRMMMRAAVCVRPGGPEVLEIRKVPIPQAREGWTLVQIKGAGLNRSELRTRQGHSPSVSFPRVLGIECVGIVAASTDPRLPEGTTVAAVMGEMGRDFDGGYAEYAVLPNALLMPITTTLPWDVLAALPESYLTAQGSLDALGVASGDRLLIRGGTSSVGMAAAAIASAMRHRNSRHHTQPAQTRRSQKPRVPRRRPTDQQHPRTLAQRAGPHPRPRRHKYGTRLTTPRTSRRQRLHLRLPQRLAHPRLRADRDDPVRHQAHLVPQQRRHGQHRNTATHRRPGRVRRH